MNVRPSILCPVDYSEASAGALRYAAAIAEHFVTRLIVLTVEDPLLTTAKDVGTGIHWTSDQSAGGLMRFVGDTFGGDAALIGMCECDVAVGKPGVEILRVARERSCDLIVMSSCGMTGPHTSFFGSTTERVLRETTVPVLVTPPANPGPVHIEDARRLLGQIVAPVDLTRASLRQTEVAQALAEALNLPLVLAHVIEPVTSWLLAPPHPGALDSERRRAAQEELDQLTASIPRHLRPEVLIVSGNPAEEAAKIVRDRHAGLVVMALHGTLLPGPRIGPVTNRILCLSQTLVLVLPPKWTKAAQRRPPARDARRFNIASPAPN